MRKTGTLIFDPHFRRVRRTCSATGPAAAGRGPGAQHALVFPALASTWDEGLPLGNAILGELLWPTALSSASLSTGPTSGTCGR